MRSPAIREKHLSSSLPQGLNKSIAILIILSLCTSVFLCSCGNDNDTHFLTSDTEEATVTETEAATILYESIPGLKSGLFCDLTHGKLLYAENTEELISPASLTKLLTACTALIYVRPEVCFTVGTELGLISPGSSLCLISEGHILSLYDLLSGLLMASGNDAAYTIAVNVARLMNSDSEISDKEAVSYFVSLMNSFAKSIGMTNSNFTNPDGWDDENQYTTVSDLLILTKTALSFRIIRDITGTAEKYVLFKSGESITWTNSNQLLNPSSPYYNNCAIGMKTGTTEKAGSCLITVFIKDEKTFIGIVAGCETNERRYEIINYLFERYT